MTTQINQTDKDLSVYFWLGDDGELDDVSYTEFNKRIVQKQKELEEFLNVELPESD